MFKFPHSSKYIIVIIGVILFTGFILFVADKFADEGRNYTLSSKLNKLGRELKEYKNKNGKYPQSLSTITSSENICSSGIINKCRKVYYKPSADLNDFKMAMPSLNNEVLFYHPEVSHELNETITNSDEVIRKYGFTCVFCYALSEDTNPNSTIGEAFIYRKNPKVFENPNDWPIIEY